MRTGRRTPTTQVRPERAVAAAVYILNLPMSADLSSLRSSVATWVAEHLDPLIPQDNTEAVIRLADGLPRYVAPSLCDALLPQQQQPTVAPPKIFGTTGPWAPKADETGTGWVIRLSNKEAVGAAGVLRSQLALKMCGLEAFGALLPECSLLCVHALYFYLTPILLRPTPGALHCDKQVDVFASLGQYPSAQMPSATPTFDKDLEALGIHGVVHPKPSSIHALVDIICASCNFNAKVVRQSIISRLMKSPYWSPLYSLALLERNSAIYKERDIVAMVGSVASAQLLAHARHIIEQIEESDLTRGFRDDWFAPLRAAPMRTDKQSAVRECSGSPPGGLFMFGQGLIELTSLQRLFLIATVSQPGVWPYRPLLLCRGTGSEDDNEACLGRGSQKRSDAVQELARSGSWIHMRTLRGKRLRVP